MEVECRVYVEARLLIRLGSNMEEEEFPAGPQPGSNQIQFGAICVGATVDRGRRR